MNKKKILPAILSVLVLWMAITANATARRGVPVGLDQTKPAAAVPTIVRLPPGWQLNRMPMGPARTEVALAPDGSFLVFSATPDGTMAKAMLYRRPLDREEATVIPGTEAACAGHQRTGDDRRKHEAARAVPIVSENPGRVTRPAGGVS